MSVPGAGGVPAYPALHDDGDSVSLRVHAEREVAQREHPRGVRRLLAIALAEKLKQARKQLPVSPEDRPAVCRDRVGGAARADG